MQEAQPIIKRNPPQIRIVSHGDCFAVLINNIQQGPDYQHEQTAKSEKMKLEKHYQ